MYIFTTISWSWEKIHKSHHGKHQTPILHLTFTYRNYMMQSRERNRHGYTSGSFLNPEASTRAFNDPPCPTPLSTTHQGSSVVASPGSLSRPPCWTAIACFRAVPVVTFFASSAVTCAATRGTPRAC
ncbi:hypothetical protein FOYG_06895 [Fusarium oxysporum NRRL 32931]|uniref:Uncharacterized protein n=1 Tax=Fusarium oxysporum NRRL 32931 TaxID=660029 RepID=W9IH53_FUSOX|nr:hypothetical protein FOYG_06895 [Fusarium oxysporum NRRL 32931]